MKFKLPSGVTRAVGRATLKAQKNAPQMLFVGGTVGVVVSGVLACRATLQLEAVLDEAAEARDEARRVRQDHPDRYSETALRSDMTKLYVRHALAVTKLYGPSIVVGGASIAMLVKSNSILRKRNAALTAAYTSLQTAFMDYRARVREELGEEKDREFLHGKHEVTEYSSNGKKVKKFKAGDENKNPYSFVFDETNINWSKNHDYNVVFLRGVQNMANDRLRSNGHVFLNEVLSDLGMKHTKAGACTGWVYEPKWEDDEQGDGFVDFGIFTDSTNSQIHDFLVGLEGGVWLDFNVDGNILDRI